MMTSKELAEKLKVSPSAVSIALTGKTGISDATRARILKAAEKYGCAPRKKGTGTGTAQGNSRGAYPDPVGAMSARAGRGHAAIPEMSAAGDALPAAPCIHYVIFMDSGMAVKETNFYSIVLEGIEAEAKKYGCTVRVSYFDANADWSAQAAGIAAGCDGILVLATEVRDGHIRTALDGGILKLPVPMVLIDNATWLTDIDCVVSDNLRGAYMAAKYLFAQGFSDIGCLRSKTRIDNFDEREAGLKKARAEQGLAETEPEVIELGIGSDGAFADMDAYLSAGRKLTSAYFADNDIIAASAIRAFRAHGYRVPEDISVIGFDNLAFDAMLEPPLTTVSVEIAELGRAAAHLLIRRIAAGNFRLTDERSGALRITVASKLILRGSVREG